MILLAGCGDGRILGTPTADPTATESVAVTGASMLPTLHAGENVTFRSLKAGTYSARPGDIILFSPPTTWAAGDRQRLIDRVIAVSGQTVACCDSQGRLLIDGKPLDETYLHGKQSDLQDHPMSFGPVVIPPGRLWAMGDNRNDAADSRFRGGGGVSGTVPVENVIGVLDPPR
ncbi:signal peptidase I [Amycolatopsis benzoatilytica]|uniref:signal peptidase I n=1 Tax=Amycolatopsis benzoatilytica TaxID=346045 RepID=UPI00248141DF|nr:signal peptidase I [Amycolatopsis benzoatilytica]